MTAIAFDRFSFRYPGAQVLALDDVTLAIEPGELVVVAGASGSGKSTLLEAVSGLVPHFRGGTVGGSVTVAGQDLRTTRPADLAGTVGALRQDPETQVVMGTVRAELAFPLENRGWGAGEIALAVEEVALALAIDGLLDRSTAELSGGELQRVALGATLAGRPKIVCLDEPTSQLDPVAGDELIGLLRRLNEDLDLTVMLAEHRLERCLGVADRVVALDGGGVAFDGGADGFLGWAMKEARELATPGAKLLSELGLPPVPGVKRARASLRASGNDDSCRVMHRGGTQVATSPPALRFERVWHEIRNGPTVLRNVSLIASPGERVALMGRNGAGKSTLLRHAAQLMRPTRGSITANGRVALLLQNPNDYLVHDSIEGESVPSDTLARVGLGELAGGRNPRDLSGGEKQRLALGIVLGDLADPPATLGLDEPTRGLDRGAKEALARLLAELPCAVIVATHDPEFAAAFATRVVLLADGQVIADGDPHELLTGGTYFATEVARITGGAALTPEEGAARLRAAEVPA